MFALEPFTPHRWLRNPHLQTILAALSQPPRRITYIRERLETPDQDFLDIDLPQVEGSTLPDAAPVVLLLHGLEGEARSTYAGITYVMLAECGLRGVGMNYRSCSGEMNRLARMYHLGSTEDVVLVHKWIEQRFPGVPVFMVGFSLGANLLLKYVGEQGAALVGRVRGAVSVSPPFQMVDQHHKINSDGGMAAFYRRRILQKLKAKIRQKTVLIREAGGDVEAGLRATTLAEFDDAITAPLFGFKDSDDYYAQAACAQFLPDIRIPTLILRSVDDPFFNVDVPYATLQANPCITAGIVDYGGHVGFVAGVRPQRQFWAQEQARRFFLSLL